MSPLEKNRIIKTSKDLTSFADQLSKCPQVTRYDTPDRKEAWELTHSFADLESSFRTFLEDQLPRLAEPNLEPQEVHGLLMEIGEQLNHIRYHIQQPRFYKYLALFPTPEEAFGTPDDNI